MIQDLSFDEIEAVDGGLRRAFFSALGSALYDLAKHVAEHGGPPPPNLGFH